MEYILFIRIRIESSQWRCYIETNETLYHEPFIMYKLSWSTHCHPWAYRSGSSMRLQLQEDCLVLIWTVSPWLEHWLSPSKKMGREQIRGHNIRQLLMAIGTFSNIYPWWGQYSNRHVRPGFNGWRRQSLLYWGRTATRSHIPRPCSHLNQSDHQSCAEW